MRIAWQWALVCAVWAIGAASTTLAQEVLPDPKVVQAGHFFHKNQQSACPEVTVVLEMEPAKAASKSDGSTHQPARRCCLFRRHAQGDYGAVAGYGAVGNFVFTPALINLNQGLPARVTADFGANIDLSGLHNLHEMKMHAAAYGAQRAAQQAAKEYMDQEMNLLQGSLQKLGATAGKPGEIAGADTTLNAQLAKIDTRLKGLEEMVQRHHDAIAILVQLAPKPVAQGKINKVDEKQLVLTDNAGSSFTFNLAKEVKVLINNKVSAPGDLKVDDVVIVFYEKTGDTLTAKEIRK